MPVLLASASPQRRSLLTQLGVPFRVHVPDVEERVSGAPVAELALANAQLKLAAALPVAAAHEVVIACDTIVEVDEEAWGKPRDRADADRMVRILRGREHRVVGGLAVAGPVINAGGDRVQHELLDATAVWFREFGDHVRERWLDSGDWAGRAGGYAIQGGGATLVAHIHGCYQNVVGLPAGRLLDLFELEPDLGSAAFAAAP